MRSARIWPPMPPEMAGSHRGVDFPPLGSIALYRNEKCEPGLGKIPVLIITPPLTVGKGRVERTKVNVTHELPRSRMLLYKRCGNYM